MLSKFKTQYDTFIRHSGVDVLEYQKTGLSWCLANEKPYFKQTSGPYDQFRGGILADEMGMGKTITMLSLICSNVVPHTLIVLPPSLISQWYNIIVKCCYTEPVIYHGSKRKNISDSKLLNASICITSYSMLKDTRFNKLCNEHWNRIVFDEAHYMRNSNTKTFKACLNFCNNHRLSSPRLSIWLLTGTPICNREKDLLSLCYIIGIHSSVVAENVARLKTDKILFRTKKDVGIVMPKLVSNDIPVLWDTQSEEYKISQLFHSQVIEPENWDSHISSDVNDYFKENPLKKTGLWIRARQSCIHPSLLASYFNTPNKLALINTFKNKNAYINTKTRFVSQKMKAILNTLYTQSSRYPNNKRIIFCNYITEMKILKDNIIKLYADKGNHIPSIEIINSTVSKKKQSTILENMENPTQILILQLSMCAEGLNLQNYNEVYFVSPTYNPSIEQQAIARCYRKGQKKDVFVFKFAMKSLINHRAENIVNALSDKMPDELISHIWQYINPSTKKHTSVTVNSTDEHINQLSRRKQVIIDKYTS